MADAARSGRAPAPRQPNRFRRAGEIVDAAARVFAERGYFGASTQDIADVLGIRQASLYYYFPSKEVALEQVCTQGVAEFIEAAKSIAKGGGKAEDKLAALMRSHLAPIGSRTHFVRVFLNERRYLPAQSRRRIGRLSRQLEAMFEAVIREGIRSGEFRQDLDPRLTTLALLGMLNGVAAWAHKEPLGDLERIAKAYVRLALKGVAAG